ncbi:MAG: hypothetical protein Q8P30_00075 [Candidatus Uhrbacteria bacterium]|nr:hypothetical protein [Candidatus Uhrbacteria bacterium]
MPIELGQTLLISLFWFPIYWLFGGVFFSTIAILKVIKLRKARFSCLFTILAAGAAYGASYSGTWFGEYNIEQCVEESAGFFRALASLIACGILELSVAGLVWFIILILIGFGALFVSRSGNASWIDTDLDLKKEDNKEIDFDDWNEDETMGV